MKNNSIFLNMVNHYTRWNHKIRFPLITIPSSSHVPHPATGRRCNAVLHHPICHINTIQSSKIVNDYNTLDYYLKSWSMQKQKTSHIYVRQVPGTSSALIGPNRAECGLLMAYFHCPSSPTVFPYSRDKSLQNKAKICFRHIATAVPFLVRPNVHCTRRKPRERYLIGTKNSSQTPGVHHCNLHAGQLRACTMVVLLDFTGQ